MYTIPMNVCTRSCQEPDTPMQKRKREDKTPPPPSVDGALDSIWKRSVEEARKSLNFEQEWTSMVEEACDVAMEEQVHAHAIN